MGASSCTGRRIAAEGQNHRGSGVFNGLDSAAGTCRAGRDLALEASWRTNMMNRAALALLGLLLGVAAPAPAAEAASKPNVVFILADDLGWTDLGCQGSKYYQTPNLDKLAKDGMRFTAGYTCGPNCQPTRAALMTGQYGPRTGVYTVGSTARFDTSRRPLIPVPNVVQLGT